MLRKNKSQPWGPGEPAAQGSARKGAETLGRPSGPRWSLLDSEQMLPWSPQRGPEVSLQGLLGVVSSREV